MSQAVLNMDGKVYVRRTLRHMKIDKVNSEYEKFKRKEFDDEIKYIHGDSM